MRVSCRATTTKFKSETKEKDSLVLVCLSLSKHDRPTREDTDQSTHRDTYVHAQQENTTHRQTDGHCSYRSTWNNNNNASPLSNCSESREHFTAPARRVSQQLRAPTPASRWNKQVERFFRKSKDTFNCRQQVQRSPSTTKVLSNGCFQDDASTNCSCGRTPTAAWKLFRLRQRQINCTKTAASAGMASSFLRCGMITCRLVYSPLICSTLPDLWQTVVIITISIILTQGTCR